MADTEDRLRRTMETILEPHRRPRRRAQARSPPRDHHRPAEAPEHQRGVDTRRRHQSGEPIPSGGVTRWTAQARQDRVPRRAADLMDKRARLRSKRPRPRSGRGVRCPRHPWRQVNLRVSPRRGAGRPHPPAMGARSVIHWCAAPGPIACRRLGPVCQPCASPLRSRAVTGPAGPAPALWPHGRAAKDLRAVFG